MQNFKDTDSKNRFIIFSHFKAFFSHLFSFVSIHSRNSFSNFKSKIKCVFDEIRDCIKHLIENPKFFLFDSLGRILYKLNRCCICYHTLSNDYKKKESKGFHLVCWITPREYLYKDEISKIFKSIKKFLKSQENY